MFSAVLRVLILYLIVLICLRLMGKRAIGEMQPFELVIALIIADLATVPMAQHNVPLLKGIIPVITLLIIHFAFSFLSKKSLFMRKAISGSNIIIVHPNGVNFSELKKLNMTLDDLIEAVRQHGYTSLNEVLYVIVETSGKVSVIPRAASAPLTSNDMKIEKQDPEVPITLIADGMLLKNNLKIIKVAQNKVISFVEKLAGKGCRIKDVCIFTLTPSGKAYIQKFGGAAIAAKVNFKGDEL